MKIKFSHQAKTIIKNLKNFDEEDFKNWYFKNLIVGGSNITEYIMNKDVEETQHGNTK